MTSALNGFTVVDFTTQSAGAQCSQLLADHGARVIRVIPTDADAFRSGGFVVWDRGKECVRLDLEAVTLEGEDSASAAYMSLVRATDVFLDDFEPSSWAQRYMDASRLRSINPRLVSCSITAYGKHGPWKDEPARDDLVLARMGILGSMPGFRPAPVHVVHPLPSAGAAVLAALGISSALFARESTGRGRSVETSLMAGALLYHPKVTGEKLAPNTFQTHPSGSAPFYSNYECADGYWVQLGCVHAGFIETAGRVMGIEATLEETRFGEGRAPVDEAADSELRGILTEIIRTRPYVEWASLFEQADVPYAPARWTHESMEDPQIRHNEMVVELQDPVLGPVTQMGVGLKLSETPGTVPGPRRDACAVNELPADLVDLTRDAVVEENDARWEAPPLEGVRVLEITNLIAGPTGGRLLADLGADVIKFEPLTGDMSRPIGRTYFYSVNFNKRSVSVDTRTEEGKEVAQRIAGSSDVLLANLRPHATERMGIGPAVNPRLIEIHLTGYGFTGPYSKRPGIDPLAQAYMGLQRAQGGPENPPVFPAQLAPTDFTTGAVGALGAVLCLLARARNGVVQRGESNLLNGGILLCSEWFCRYEGQPRRPLADQEQLGLSAYHRLFQLEDGWIYVAADRPAERRALEAALGVDATPARTGDEHPNAGPLAQAFAHAIGSWTVESALARFADVGVPAAPAVPGDSEIFLNSPHAEAADIAAHRQHPNAGALRVAWNYIGFSGSSPSDGKPTPLLGEHSREVLSEIGYSSQDIEHLHEVGVVKTELPGS